ncbi:hypothetical protein Bbelb_242250 [Branchiostoma belcheri]|nr:hypothetical protein Bbelb_242250 [Branchiostoma belcheri]
MTCSGQCAVTFFVELFFCRRVSASLCENRPQTRHGGIPRHYLGIFGFVKVEKKISAGDFTTGDHSSTQRGSAVVSSQLRGRRPCGLWNGKRTIGTPHSTDKKMATALLRLELVMLLFAIHDRCSGNDFVTDRCSGNAYQTDCCREITKNRRLQRQ